MPEMILPGTYIEVRAEGLIVAGRVTVGNLGVVGTASKGKIEEPVILGSYAEATDVFGDYDPFINGESNELTLVRALEQAFKQGASKVFAVRVSGKTAAVPPANTAAKSGTTLQSLSGDCVRLTGRTEGTWANEISVNVAAAEASAFVENEDVADDSGARRLKRRPIVKSAQNRIRFTPAGGGLEQLLDVVYDDHADALVAGQVQIDRTTGELEFAAGAAPAAGDTITASYGVAAESAVQVTLRYRDQEEVFSVASGDDLVRDVKDRSSLVNGVALANSDDRPSATVPAGAFVKLTGGSNGAAGADYQAGLDKLLDQPAHIIVAAGQDETFGDELAAHCRVASSDTVRRERIAVVGSQRGASLAELTGHNLNSDRLIYVAPGIMATDAAASPRKDVTLPAAYTAAAVAGLLASQSPHISLTNKILQVGGLETAYTSAELTQLVQSRLLALEERQGFRVVKGITTSTNSAFHQITTRRIVDFAKFGVRSAANPYIGRLNNARVRGALQATINGFLAEMVNDEMLVSYELEVSATRQQEIRGIVQVVMTLRPTFSIDFIKVTMFLG